MAARARVRPWLRYLAGNVRALRVRQGLTQEGLGDQAGVEPRYIQDIERARANPTIAILVALADALRVDPRRLLRPAVMKPTKPGRPLRRAGRRPLGARTR